jgi:hypothetical protein
MDQTTDMSASYSAITPVVSRMIAAMTAAKTPIWVELATRMRIAHTVTARVIHCFPKILSHRVGGRSPCEACEAPYSINARKATARRVSRELATIAKVSTIPHFSQALMRGVRV